TARGIDVPCHSSFVTQSGSSAEIRHQRRSAGPVPGDLAPRRFAGVLRSGGEIVPAAFSQAIIDASLHFGMGADRLAYMHRRPCFWSKGRIPLSNEPPAVLFRGRPRRAVERRDGRAAQLRALTAPPQSSRAERTAPPTISRHAVATAAVAAARPAATRSSVERSGAA